MQLTLVKEQGFGFNFYRCCTPQLKGKKMNNKLSISMAITDFLEQKGHIGATLTEVMFSVNESLGRQVPKPSVQAALYKRLPSDKGPYTPRYERFYVDGKSRYRLLQNKLAT